MNAVPPKIARANRVWVFVVLALGAAGVASVVYFFNPSAYPIYPVCQFHRLTGLNCPGCGATRACYALLHGEVITALHDNLLFVAGLAMTICRGAWFALNRWRGRPNDDFFPPRYLIPLLVILALFGILRNLPAFSFLSPSS